MTSRGDDRSSDFDLRRIVEATGVDAESGASAPPAAPITRDDLVQVFGKDHDAETALQLADDLSPSRPGQIWSLDILLGVAALSSEHHARMQAYLGWTAEQMTSELAKLRANRQRGHEHK